MTEELNPCPFCGGEPILCEGYKTYRITCKFCMFDLCQHYKTKQDIIDKWNTRV